MINIIANIEIRRYQIPIRRAWIGFHKLFPLSDSKKIVEKYYNKNQKFSRAEDEMRISLKGIISGRRSIHPNLERNRSLSTQPASTNNFTLCIKRLKQQEITRALKGDLSDFKKKSLKMTPFAQAKKKKNIKYNNETKKNSIINSWNLSEINSK